jgi:hypothetical protein
MGTEADIQARLLELEKKQPEVRFKADSHHAILDETRRPLRYSPMTHAQESNLNPQRFGVGLVFASRATGLSDLPDALRGFLPRDFPDAGIYAEIPGDITDSTRLEHWLEHFLKQHQKLEQLILCHRMKDVTSEQMIALIQTAITFCQRQHAKKRWMRLLFVFDPSSTWKWLSVEPSVREQLENQVDAVEYLRRWDEIGVRQWLEQHDQIDSQEIRTAVIDATGGWAPLLDHLFEKISPQDEDPRTAANNLIRELEDTNAPLRQKFSASLGLVEDNAILQILQFIRDEGEGRIEREYITPHLIGGSPLLHSAQCAAAIEYLYRMGCIEFDDDDDDVVLIEPTVSKVVE